MSRQYVLKKFLAVVPPDLLREYLDRHGVGREVDWNLVCPNNLDAVVEAISSSSRELQEKIGTDFRDMNDMFDSSGVLALIDVASRLRPEANIEDELLLTKSVQRQVFSVFLNHPEVFHVAHRVDEFNDSRGYPIDGMPALPDDWDGEATKDRIGESISNFFQYHEGRGEGCEVEYLAVGDRHYWFVALENYTYIEEVFDESHRICVQPRRPVFSVSYRYDAKTQVLEISGFRRKNRIDELKGIFSRAVFGLDLHEVGSQKVFSLKHLLDPSFEIEPQRDLGVTFCKLKKVKLNAHGRTGLTTTIEAGEHYARQTMIDCVQSFLSTATISMADAQVHSVTLVATFAPEPGKRKGRTKTFTVHHDGSTTLNNDSKCDLLRSCLVRWRIDSTGSDGKGAAKHAHVAQTAIYA